MNLLARWNSLVADVLNGRISSVLTRGADLLLVGAVAAMVGLMIVPLPTWLLDLFLSVNITAALVILMVSIYIPNAVQIASYPTLLLITTLYRLSLDISATRLILLQADAGEVVESFGQFVVQGNFVVGAVIFLIITLVQFIVITKGAERVAEVSARFTLDAIPGKQMSIDADMRSGTITFEQARKRRDELSRESQFYGAMDGAMKFVKGDAIAGIVITLINIIAGLIIGVAMNGMEAGEAAQVYTVLTIGSGLVSQIPALLISISAGMVVTRVAAEAGQEGNLGSQVVGQIIAQPKAIGVAAGLMLVLALIPGLPKIPFFVLAAAIGGIAWAVLRPKTGKQAEIDAAAAEAPPVEMPQVLATVPVVLRVGPALAPVVTPATDRGRKFVESMNLLRESLYIELGVLYPPVQVATDPNASDESFEIWLNEVPAVRGEVKTEHVLVAEPATSLSLFGLQGDAVPHPLTGRPATWIRKEQAELALKAGFAVADAGDVLLQHLAGFLRRGGHELIGLQEVHSMVERLKQIYPALVEQVVPRPVSLPLLTDILKRLAQEMVSIRDLKAILESLGDWARAEDDPAALVERVRADLRRRICYQLSRGGTRLFVYELHPKLEEMFRSSIRKSGGAQVFTMATPAVQEVLGAANRAFAKLPSTAQTPVIVTERDIRRYVRQLLSADYPDVSVLSYDQLTPQIELFPLGQVA
ncbi:MAG: type III secretion system export apparatus subunit SctV [Bryobacteraceae bacterium]|nr:type III secretion system export apparatus subunit SctV [Bryobacteraceae bacterium]